jgi:hypothetical protein
MFKRILMLGVVGLIFLGTNNSFAQFGSFQNMLGSAASKATGGGVSINDLGSSRDGAISAYLESTKELDLSLEKAGEAFGVKKEVLEKLAVVESLKEGNVNNNDLDKARQSSEEAQAIIAQKMKETSAPSAEDKALMAESMIHLASGIVKDIALIGTVQKLSSQAQSAMTSASPMEIFKVKDIAATAFTLAKAVPLDLGLEKNILGSYVAYAKANNIATPSNASDLLKGE